MKTITAMMDLHEQVALVIGAAGQLALAVEETLLEMGATLILWDINKNALTQRASQLTNTYPNPPISIRYIDIRNERETRLGIENTAQINGHLDIIIHCAAYTGRTPKPGWNVQFQDQSVQAWDDAMRVNLTSVLYISQEVYYCCTMRAKEAKQNRRTSKIILFSSIYGMVAPDYNMYAGTTMDNPMGYGASKGGIIQLTRYLASKMAPSVRVNCISPGGIYHDSTDKQFSDRYITRTPLARMASPEDIKGAVAYLASDMSNYVTGQNLVVDGGWTIW